MRTMMMRVAVEVAAEEVPPSACRSPGRSRRDLAEAAWP